MTTYAFTPSPTGAPPFQFQPTFDGQNYLVQVFWSVFGQRWYMSIYDLSGNLIVTKAVVGSPLRIYVNSITWNQGRLTLVTVTPHDYKQNRWVPIQLQGATPDALNGQYQAYVVDSMTLLIPMNQDPGAMAPYGTIGYDIDLVWQYFNTSTLVYRAPSNQFEVSP